VGLADFYHESKCLLLFRLGLHSLPGHAQKYLKSFCQCPYPSASSSSSDIHAIHHQEGHRSTLFDLSTEILKRVEILTRVDVQLYKLALLQFLKEMIWLESDDALGRRVLCEPKLKNLEPELSYLGVNVTEAFESLKAH